MEIRYRARFLREYRKLSLAIQHAAEAKEAIFCANPFDGRLKTHKLHGPLSDFYAFSVTYRFRIIFAFLEGDIVEFYSVGDHDIYD